jgi:hypothetical protein
MQFTSTHLRILSLLCLHQSLSGSGYRQRTFLLLWVPALSPCLSYQLLTATAHNDCTAAVRYLTHSATKSLHFTQLNRNNSTECLLITPRHGPHGKHRSSFGFQLLLSGPLGKHRFPVSSLVHVRNLLPSKGRCLLSHYLATGMHATIYIHAYKCGLVAPSGRTSFIFFAEFRSSGGEERNLLSSEMWYWVAW